MGIVTSILVKTFPVPPSATVFQYDWDLTAADAASAAEQFQNFAKTNIPQEIAADIMLLKGSSKGKVHVRMFGGWYASADRFSGVIAPLLNTLPPPSQQNITAGTYIQSVEILGKLGRLNTTGIADQRNNFYTKSIMTPEKEPMTIKALNALTAYIGDVGFTADTVRCLHQHIVFYSMSICKT